MDSLSTGKNSIFMFVEKIMTIFKTRNNEYLKNKTAPIQSDVLVTLDPEGNVLHRWGAGR